MLVDHFDCAMSTMVTRYPNVYSISFFYWNESHCSNLSNAHSEIQVAEIDVPRIFKIGILVVQLLNACLPLCQNL